MRRPGAKAGFTLTELVIAVGMIGLLAALAIPGFITYQARARRGEAMANVGGIARAEKGYYAEAGIYYEAATFPVTVADDLGAKTHGWTAAADAEFAGLGWEPEGRVRYSYDVNTGATACSCDDACFTATGYGDVDENDSISAIVYVVPGTDPDTGAPVRCPPHLFGLGAPLGPANEPFVHVSTDLY